MSDEKHFFDNPEINDYIHEKIHILINESDRGAVLLAMSQIDNELENFLKKITPIDMISKEKKWIERSTISSKLNIVYSCRLIPRNLFESITKLNKIRNSIAHNIETFKLENYNSILNEIFELLGAGTSTYIHNFSLEYMLENTISHLMKVKNPSNQEEFALKSRLEIIEYLQSDTNRLNKIEEPLLKMKLTIGILFISALIINHREQFLKIIGDKKIVSDIGI